MRKVTEQTAKAFINGTTKRVGNTQVIVHDNVSKMYLHGNLIAKYDLATRHFSITSADWLTNTTKERLNGILEVAGYNDEEKIYKEMGVWYMDIEYKHIDVSNGWHSFRDCNK